MEDVCVFDNAKERAELFQYLSELPVEYHKEYKRFNKIDRNDGQWCLQYGVTTAPP